MPSFKYVIELSDMDKEELLEIVTKGTSPAVPFSAQMFCSLQTGGATNT